jgi:hypothetical protein
MDEMLCLMKKYKECYMDNHAPGGKCFKTIRRKYLRQFNIAINVSYSYVNRQTGETVIQESVDKISVADFDLSVYEKSSESVRHKVQYMLL